MVAKVGTGIKGKPVIAKATGKDAANIKLDPKTLAYLNSVFGSEAAWVNDPQLGPVILEIARQGIQSTDRIADFLRTHATDAKGKVVTVAPDKSWMGVHGSTVRNNLILQKTDIGTYNQSIQDTLDKIVTPLAQQMGLSLDPASLRKVAENAFVNGWTNSTDQMKSALLGQYHYATPTSDANAVPAGGTIGEAQSKFATIAADYGIPVPADPAKMTDFVKAAVGPQGTTESFTEYAKNQAKILYPFMSAALDAGATVKGYFAPYTTQIANTLDLSPDQINWQDPKWQSLIAKPDPAKPGMTVPQSMSDIMRTIKTNPQYGYDNTQAGIADANNFGENLKSMFGY